MKRTNVIGIALLVVFVATGGCGDEPKAPTASDAEPAWDYYTDSALYLPENVHTNVIRRLIFLRDEGSGTIDGFNLDDRVSDSNDLETCGKADRVDSDGREGIDNQLAVIFNALALIVEDTPQIAIQGAINEGRILMMVELEGLDDLKNDDQVTLRFFRGAGRPIIGNLGLINPYQTFLVDYTTPMSIAKDVSLVNGVIEAGPIDFEVPVDVLDANFPMAVQGGRIRVELSEDGTMTGLIGGSINVDKVLRDFGEVVAGNEDEMARPIFERSADLRRVDGQCTELSLAFGIEGHIAFAVHDLDQEEAESTGTTTE